MGEHLTPWTWAYCHIRHPPMITNKLVKMSRPFQLILQIDYALAIGEMELFQIVSIGTTAASIIFMILTKSTLIYVVDNRTVIAPQQSVSRSESVDIGDVVDEDLSKEELMERLDEQREQLRAHKSEQKKVVKELKLQLEEYAEGGLMKTDRMKKMETMLKLFKTSDGPQQQQQRKDDGGDEPVGDGGSVGQASTPLIEEIVKEAEAQRNKDRLEIQALMGEVFIHKEDNEALRTVNDKLRLENKVLKTDNEEKDRANEVLKMEVEALKTDVKLLKTEAKE